MAASVKITLGDMFHGPSDLIVLPCSTLGTVTDSVALRLAKYKLPAPQAGMRFGQVAIAPFKGGENIAQFVAFAASVHVAFSESMISFAGRVGAIENIAFALGEFTQQNSSVRLINVPLLGSGAGNLNPEVVVSALKAGFLRAAHKQAVLRICVLGRDDFDRLRAKISPPVRPAKKSVRVFISHTSSTAASLQWVKDLTLFLIGRGLDARLDQFDLHPGMDLPQWMTNELVLADKVVIVCDEAYKQKADARLGGVGWETRIIQGDMMGLPPDSTKYQVVVLSEDLMKGLPIYLKATFALHAGPHDDLNAFREVLVSAILNVKPDGKSDTTEFAG